MGRPGFKGDEAGMVGADLSITDCYGHGCILFSAYRIQGIARKAEARKPTALPSLASLATVPPQPRVSSSGCAAMMRMDFILGPLSSLDENKQSNFLPTEYTEKHGSQKAETGNSLSP